MISRSEYRGCVKESISEEAWEAALEQTKLIVQEQKEQKESRKKDAQQKNPAKGKKKNRSGEAR